jgi:restriction endonuclease S subunit
MIYRNKFKLKDLITSISFGKRPASDKMDKGLFPFVTIEQDGNFFTDTKDFSGDTVLIQTAKHSKEVIPVIKFQTGDFGLAQNIMAVSFDPSVCDSKFMYFMLLNIIEEINHKCYLNNANLNTQRFREFVVEVPSLEQQSKIASLLNGIKESRDLASNGARLSNELFESSIHQAFSSDDSETSTIGDFLKESRSGSTSDGSMFPVHSIQKNGIFTIKKETSGKNADRYKIGKLNDIIYRPAGILESYINIVSEDSLVPTIYNLLTVKDDSVDTNFFIHYLRSQYFAEILSSKVSVGVRTNLSSKDFLDIEIPSLPPIGEQKRMAGFLEDLLRYRDQWRKEEENLSELLYSTMKEVM